MSHTAQTLYKQIAIVWHSPSTMNTLLCIMQAFHRLYQCFTQTPVQAASSRKQMERDIRVDENSPTGRRSVQLQYYCIHWGVRVGGGFLYRDQPRHFTLHFSVWSLEPCFISSSSSSSFISLQNLVEGIPCGAEVIITANLEWDTQEACRGIVSGVWKCVATMNHN